MLSPMGAFFPLVAFLSNDTKTSYRLPEIVFWKPARQLKTARGLIEYSTAGNGLRVCIVYPLEFYNFSLWGL